MLLGGISAKILFSEGRLDSAPAVIEDASSGEATIRRSTKSLPLNHLQKFDDTCLFEYPLIPSFLVSFKSDTMSTLHLA